MTRRTLFILALITAVAALAACSGGDGDTNSDDAVVEAPSEEVENDATPEEAEPPEADDADNEPEPGSKSDPQALRELKGKYETSLTLKDVRKAGAIDLAIDGDYKIEVTGDGYLVPENAKFEEAAGRPIQPAEALVTKGTLSTKLYSGFPECGTLDAGTYAWTLNGDALTFKLKKDECGLRKALFLTHPWTQA